MAERGIIYGTNDEERLLSYALQIEDDSKNVKILSLDFVPGQWDIICQRGKESFEHTGNVNFRLCVEKNLDTYMKADNRQDKADIVSDIIDAVTKDPSRPCAGFVKKDLLSRRWYRISKKETRDKVGQALRDTIKALKTSSTKKNKRKSRQSSCRDSMKKESIDNAEKNAFGRRISDCLSEAEQDELSMVIEGELSRELEAEFLVPGSLVTNRKPSLSLSNDISQDSSLESLYEPLDYKSDHRDGYLIKDANKRIWFDDVDEHSVKDQSFKRRKLENECMKNNLNASYVFFDPKKAELDPFMPLSLDYSDNYLASSKTAQFLLDFEPIPMTSLQFPQHKVDHACTA